MTGVVCKQTNEPSKEEVHDNRMGGSSYDLCVQEVLTLPPRISNCLPHRSRLAEVSGEQTGFV